MGCSQSKIENEEAVLRCKERKRLMKDAVVARNAFSAAHSGYSTALRSTGASLCDYGHAESHDLRSSSSSYPPSYHNHSLDPLLPPPPPVLGIANPTQPLQRAATMPEISIIKPDPKSTDTIREEDDDDGAQFEDNNDDPNIRRRRGRASAAKPEEVVPAPPPPLPSLAPEPPTREEVVVPPVQEEEPKNSTFDYIFSYQERPILGEIDEIGAEKKDDGSEGQYGEVERKKSSGGVDFDTKVVESSAAMAQPENAVIEKVKKTKAMTTKQAMPSEGKRGGAKTVSSNVTLSKILEDIDDQFLKASGSASEVSKLLEANRLHYHSNFADNRGYIDHSAKLMRVITWNRSIKGLQNAEDANNDATENETFATILDKLLAWEKKLYDEVKAGEVMKSEYNRKVAMMNKQKKHGADSLAYEKAKAAVTHLHTRYIVDMQSMDSTVSEISHLRDDHLYPKLTSLVDGMAKMWETMYVHHKNQMKIVEDIRSLDVAQSPKETSKEHYERTAQLWNVVSGWHSQFEMLVMHQKKYIIALHGWLKLNLIPIDNNLKEKVSSPPQPLHPPMEALVRAWNEHLEKLPFEIAKNAISSFGAIVLSLKLLQEDEGKMKLKCDQTRKELARKTRAFEDWHSKYSQNRIPADGVDPERPRDVIDKDPVVDRQLEIEILKNRLDQELEEHRKHCTHVREKSLGCLKLQLPELFRALTEFSLASSNMYKKLQVVAHSEKQVKKPS